MPKVGGRRKKTRTHKEATEEDLDLIGQTPKAFILKRGKVSSTIRQLIDDYRDVMYPFTSMNLQESDKTKMKDYIQAAGYYLISHMIIMTQTNKNSYIRFIQNPRGPTFTFRILKYANRNEVLNAQRKFKSFSRVFSPPLLVMNGFQTDFQTDDPKRPTSEHIKLVGNMIQSMFPAINVQNTNPKTQKRVILFSYKNDKIYIRHYYISFNLKGIDKKMKKIIKANKLPNLSKYNSFSDFLQNNHQMFASDTEQSDLEELEIENKQHKKQQMSVRLHEVGPRLELKLYKIEEGFMQGNVVYNRVVSKTNKAIEKLRKIKRRKMLLKYKRREEQEQNLQKKTKKQDIEEFDNVNKKVKKQ
ncbi:unnamed protein product [Paramecium octaurelia]|uniref:Brix domain-containing protein n=1 Tax=Paramecium octaurelia TaxID=43137 RepID=A0A8S1WNA1_PAROT|nr:unnamed protein product [Paramecium octaurelia]